MCQLEYVPTSAGVLPWLYGMRTVRVAVFTTTQLPSASTVWPAHVPVQTGPEGAEQGGCLPPASRKNQPGNGCMRQEDFVDEHCHMLAACQTISAAFPPSGPRWLLGLAGCDQAVFKQLAPCIPHRAQSQTAAGRLWTRLLPGRSGARSQSRLGAQRPPETPSGLDDSMMQVLQSAEAWLTEEARVGGHATAADGINASEVELGPSRCCSAFSLHMHTYSAATIDRHLCGSHVAARSVWQSAPSGSCGRNTWTSRRMRAIACTRRLRRPVCRPRGAPLVTPGHQSQHLVCRLLSMIAIERSGYRRRVNSIVESLWLV